MEKKIFFADTNTEPTNAHVGVFILCRKDTYLDSCNGHCKGPGLDYDRSLHLNKK